MWAKRMVKVTTDTIHDGCTHARISTVAHVIVEIVEACEGLSKGG